MSSPLSGTKPASTHPRPRIFYGYYIVAAAFLIFATLNGTSFSFGVFLKPLMEEFGWTRAATAGAFSLYMLVTGLFSVVMGRLTDRLGPRLVLTVCGLFLSSGYLLSSRVQAIWQLYLSWSVLSAIGMSGGLVPLSAVVSRWFVRRRGLMNGLAVAGIGAGNAIFSPIAAWLVVSYGWRTSYVVLGISSLIIILLAAQVLIRDPRQKNLLPDGDAVDRQGNHGVSATGGYSFGQALRSRWFWMLFAMYFCFGFNVMITLTHIVPHVTDVGISVATAASILGTVGIVSIVGRIGMGGASDWFGSRRLFILGFILLIIAYSTLLVVRLPWQFYLVAVFVGLPYGGLVALRPQIAADLFGLKAHGSILGMVTFIHSTGAAVGSFTAGWIFDTTGSYSRVFLISALLAATGLILTSLLDRRAFAPKTMSIRT